MADLVTHVCTALLPAAFVPSRWVSLVAVGTVLPDAFGRVVPLALERLLVAGLPVPDWLMWPWGALHEPLGWTLVCVATALAFVERDRGRVLAALVLGCALHTGLDVLQFHHGEGYLLLAPFSLERFELGWMGSEATVPAALPLLGLTAAAWAPRAVERWLGEPADLSVYRVLWVTLPVHLLLPWLGAWQWETWGVQAVGWTLLWIHAAFALFLATSWHWWRGRWMDVGVVVLVDHLVTALGATLVSG